MTDNHAAEIAALDLAAREGAPEGEAIDCGSAAADWCKAPWGEVCVLHTRDGNRRPHVHPPGWAAQPCCVERTAEPERSNP